MGRKYGSLHIRLENPDYCINAIVDALNSVMDTVIPTSMEIAAERLGLNLDQHQLSALNSLIKTKLACYKKQSIVKHGVFVSMSDERITFENIRTIALKLSVVLNIPVFFSSVFDDDVFLFGLCQNNEIVALHMSGECEAYGMTCVSHNIENLAKYALGSKGSDLGLQNLSRLDMENALIKIFGFQFNIELV